MRRDLAVKVRLAASEMARLDEMRGPTSRAEYLRRLLQEPPPEGDPTHHESLQILYGLAKDGRVGAAVALERALRDAIDRRAEVPMLTVQRTVSSGEIVALAKTKRSHRQVPLSDRALEAIEAVPRRLDVPFVFPAKRGGVLDLNHFRQREWTPAIEAAGIARPARMYDTRSTFASNALDAGVSVFQLARVMGTFIAMIERHYGTLLDGTGADIARRLNAVEERVSTAAEHV